MNCEKNCHSFKEPKLIMKVSGNEKDLCSFSCPLVPSIICGVTGLIAVHTLGFLLQAKIEKEASLKTKIMKKCAGLKNEALKTAKKFVI